MNRLSEYPSEEEGKAAIMAVQPGSIGIQPILEGMADPRWGFVIWDATPPTGSRYEHRLTFVDAINIGLSFCNTDTRYEWCVLGQMALVVVRSLPVFEQIEPALCSPLVYIGKIKTTHIYTDERERRPPAPSNEFVVGVINRAVRGQIIHPTEESLKHALSFR